MKYLNEKDRDYLFERGFSETDLKEIEYAISKTRYYIVNPDGTHIDITPTQAENKLGHEEWLNAIAKSAFFVETTRVTDNNEKIKLHSKIYSN